MHIKQTERKTERRRQGRVQEKPGTIPDKNRDGTEGTRGGGKRAICAIHTHQKELVLKLRRHMGMMTTRILLECSLVRIHQRGRKRRKQRYETTRRLHERITSRDYAGLLYMSNMLTLHDQKGRMGAMFLTLPRFDINKPGNRPSTTDWEAINSKGTNKTQKMTWMRMHDSSPSPMRTTKKKTPRYALDVPRMAETWTAHGGSSASGGNQLTEKAPWMVPPGS